MLGDMFRRLFGGRPAAARRTAGDGGVPDPVATAEEADPALAASWQRRDAYWAEVGAVEADVLGHLISPGLTGGPAWPTLRQAYRVIRRPQAIIIATDGLSDPFDGVTGGGNGFEVELFVETPDIAPAHAGPPGDIGHLSQSWAFELVSHVAGTVANAGGITAQLARHGVLSMELPGVSKSAALGSQLPAGFATSDDCLGLLIGLPVPDFAVRIADMPLSPITMVPLTLIRANELEALRAGGADARKALAERRAAAGLHHVTTFGS
ncbi:hypothetical protein BN1110_00714 [bacterium YEK0313]|nr:hypothetical protein BN1110_00714 [bacterium YEK0313]